MTNQQGRYYTTRKFLLTCTCLVIVVALALFDKLTSEVILGLGTVLGFFSGADVAEKYVQTRSLMRHQDRYDYDPLYDDYRGRRY